MLMDILIGVPILIFILIGLRDGVVRKFVAIVMLIAGLFLGQIFMYDFGQLLSDNGWVNSTNASMYGFLFIFLGTAIIQGLLYKIITGSYKIGGFADRVGGMVLGFVEGALFISSLLFIFSLTGFPSRETKRDARLYKPIVNIAPQILDFTSLIKSESIEKIQEAGKTPRSRGYGQGSNPKSIDSAAVIEARKQNENLNKTREDFRKNNQ